MGFATVWGDLMELEPTLSVLTLLCGVILLVILTKLRGFIDEAIAGLEEDLALALEIPRDDAGRWRGEGGDELVP